MAGLVITLMNCHVSGGCNLRTDELSRLNNMLVLRKDMFDYFGLLHFSADDLLQLEDVELSLLRSIALCDGKKAISRGPRYYGINNVHDAFEIDNLCTDLASRLYNKSDMSSRKTLFSAFENRINAGLRLYYSYFEKSLSEGLDVGVFFKLRQRILADYSAIIDVMHGRVPVLDLTYYESFVDDGLNLETRVIEMDHKYLLLSRMKDIWSEGTDIKSVCAPMLGGVEIPFMMEVCFNKFNDYLDAKRLVPLCFHIIYGEHDNKRYGDIIRDESLSDSKKLCGVFPAELHNQIRGGNLLVLDDNTGTGETLRNLKKFFSKFYSDVNFGFIELSWKYLEDIKSGKRAGLLFDVKDIRHPTFRNYRHHNILDRLRSCIKSEDIRGYVTTLKKLGMQNGFVCDTDCLLHQGKNYSDKNNITFMDAEIRRAAQLSYDIETSDSNFILSCDIMDGKIRYLEQYDPFEIADLIMNYRTVNIIDIDRHLGKEYNEDIIKYLCALKRCRVGGGVRSKEDIRKLFSLGADKVIVTTCASSDLLSAFPSDKLVVGIDSIDRRTGRHNDVLAKIKRLLPYCSEVQYICVETDGKMKGGDVARGLEYARSCPKPFSVVGGITHLHELHKLKDNGVSAVVGRAIFENMFGDKYV